MHEKSQCHQKAIAVWSPETSECAELCVRCSWGLGGIGTQLGWEAEGKKQRQHQLLFWLYIYCISPRLFLFSVVIWATFFLS